MIRVNGRESDSKTGTLDKYAVDDTTYHKCQHWLSSTVAVYQTSLILNQSHIEWKLSANGNTTDRQVNE